MQLAYKYKLQPTKPQKITISAHLELCRRQYNYRLGERFLWWESTRTNINACPLNVSIRPVADIYQNIPEIRTQTRDGRKRDELGNPITKKGDIQPNIIEGFVQWQTVQLADLKNTKKLFPEYKSLDSQVLQDVVNRVESAFSNFIKPDRNGNRRGKPKFKGKHYYKSFTYTQLNRDDIIKDSQDRICVNMCKIGLVPIVFHRPLPDGFKVKTGTVISEADGFYICLTLEDKSVPVAVAEIPPTVENSLGVDLGVINYGYLSNGVIVKPPQFFRIAAKKLAKLQQRLATKTKFSKPWKILKHKIARLHQHIARQRLDFQFKLAYQIFTLCDVLFVEDLKIKNMTRRAKPKINNDGTWLPNNQSAKGGLNKSMLDAAHGQFLDVLKYVAWKLGKNVIEVDPKGTSQHCWNCLQKVSKELSDRWHSCECGEELDRDHNSAKLIKKIGLFSDSGGGTPSLKTALARQGKKRHTLYCTQSALG